MKIAVIGDLHFGIHKNSDYMIDSQIKFFKEQLIPYLKQQNIKGIILLGDLFDNRTSLNIKIKNDVFDLFEKDLLEFNIFIILGNHDIFYNSSLKVNSLKFLTKFKNITIIENITKTKLDNKNILFVPWIVDNNEFINYIDKIEEKIDYCFGHFNFIGFNYDKTRVSDDGLDISTVTTKIKKIYTGHFHTRSTRTVNNCEINYIGSPYQLTRSCIDENRGFTIIDFETENVEYINNDVSLKYIKINYPDSFSEETIKGNIIDVYIDYDKYDEDKVNSYIEKIESYAPATNPNKVIYNTFKLDNDIDITDYNSKSTPVLIRKYVDSQTMENTETIYNNLIALYEQARGEG